MIIQCKSLLSLVFLSFLSIGTGAAEEWTPFDECSEKPGPDKPGGSRKTALTIGSFDDLYAFAINEAETWNDPEWEESRGYFAPSCKWVRLSGNFRSTKYHNYEGQLYQDAPAFYKGGNIVGARISHYFVENFLNDNINPAEFYARDITVTGRFIDLCAAYDAKLKRENAELLARSPDATPLIGFEFGGPCHYGQYTGLMLHDVVVESIGDSPKLAGGDFNYGIIGDLAPYPTDNNDEVIAKTKEWIALAKAGPERFKQGIIKNQSDCNVGDRKLNSSHCERIVDLAIGARSTGAFLIRNDLLRDISPEIADIRVFKGSFYYGCVCLINDCTNQWPLFNEDAKFYVGTYACASITHYDQKWEILR